MCYSIEIFYIASAPIFLIKEKFKASLLAQAEELRKLISACVEDFHTKGYLVDKTLIIF